VVLEDYYTLNGELITTTNEVYVPDACMDFTRDFFQRHREEPFYFYFSTHLIHGPILRTPDSSTNTTDFTLMRNNFGTAGQSLTCP
jgi:hypothetical protein